MSSRSREMDIIPGFIKIQVLKPNESENEYLIFSPWDSEDHFIDWKESDQFTKGHKWGFEDMATSPKEAHEPPVRSVFKTYKILSD